MKCQKCGGKRWYLDTSGAVGMPKNVLCDECAPSPAKDGGPYKAEMFHNGFTVLPTLIGPNGNIHFETLNDAHLAAYECNEIQGEVDKLQAEVAKLKERLKCPECGGDKGYFDHRKMAFQPCEECGSTGNRDGMEDAP